MKAFRPGVDQIVPPISYKRDDQNQIKMNENEQIGGITLFDRGRKIGIFNPKTKKSRYILFKS